MLEENDQLFMHFMVIAFLLHHKKKFIETDGSSIPVFFSKNQIGTKELLTEIVKSAREIRKNTPVSLRLLVKNLEIFKSRTTRVKDMYEKYCPEQILAMPVLAEELLSNVNLKKRNMIFWKIYLGHFSSPGSFKIRLIISIIPYFLNILNLL